MKHDIVDGFVILRHHQGQWTVQATNGITNKGMEQTL